MTGSVLFQGSTFIQSRNLWKSYPEAFSVLHIPILEDGSNEIAKRSRGTPRIANRMLRGAWDFALVRAGGKIKQDVANTALTILGIDRLGLDELDRKILGIISRDFGGGPVGAKTIAISAGEEVTTIEEVYESYLIHIGFIKRTTQGRETTEAARGRLKNGG